MIQTLKTRWRMRCGTSCRILGLTDYEQGFGEQDTAYLACEAYPRGSGEYELLVMAFMSGPINDTLPWDGGTAYLEGDRNRQVRLLPYEIVFASYVECDADDRRRANVRLAATNAAWLAIHSSTDLPIPPFLLSSVPYAALAHLHCTLRPRKKLRRSSGLPRRDRLWKDHSRHRRASGGIRFVRRRKKWCPPRATGFRLR